MYENERIKREFFDYLKGAKGFARSSVKEFAEAIGQWQRFSGDADFATFDKTKALAFRDWLAGRDTKTKAGKLAIATQYHYLRRIKKFFAWLSDQTGYKGKMQKSHVEFLRLSSNDARIARAGSTKAKPTLEEAKKIIESIEVNNEIDRRDRALISFALITGCRISAIVSLKMKNFDKAQKLIDQNPGDGVRTKNSKKILNTFFPIGWDAPETYFLEWYEYLEHKGHQSDDPIFPATANDAGVANYSKENVGRLEWKGSSGARKIFEKRCKNAGVSYFHPHSFRHLVVALMSQMRLTEQEKRAISQNLGHANVGTTFGSYGYGAMSDDESVRTIKKLKDFQESSGNRLILTDEERAVLERILGRK